MRSNTTTKATKAKQAKQSKAIKMSSTQFHMSDAVQRGAKLGLQRAMEAGMTSIIEEVVIKLSKEFGFDVNEAMEHIGAVSSKKVKPKQIQLPWCGEVNAECCQAIKVNKGLFSQCLDDKGDGDFCLSLIHI